MAISATYPISDRERGAGASGNPEDARAKGMEKCQAAAAPPAAAALVANGPPPLDDAVPFAAYR
jgi:hypothetical protein